jgi:hypothetical protein
MNCRHENTIKSRGVQAVGDRVYEDCVSVCSKCFDSFVYTETHSSNSVDYRRLAEGIDT